MSIELDQIIRLKDRLTGKSFGQVMKGALADKFNIDLNTHVIIVSKDVADHFGMEESDFDDQMILSDLAGAQIVAVKKQRPFLGNISWLDKN